MPENSRRPLLLRLLALFFLPLLAIPVVIWSNGDGIGVALVMYVALLLGLAFAVAMVLAVHPLNRVMIAIAMAFGMLLVHLVVEVGGCTFVLAVHG
jgi:hypothetical protein